MKKIILAIVIALAALSSINAMGKDFEPQYDSDTQYIQNYADWGEYESWGDYEVWCYENGIEPIYSEWEKSFVTDGHCDFETMEKLGIDLEKETLKLFENID